MYIMLDLQKIPGYPNGRKPTPSQFVDNSVAVLLECVTQANGVVPSRAVLRNFLLVVEKVRRWVAAKSRR